EIDVAEGAGAVPDRDLAGDERFETVGLERGDHVAHAAAGLVYFIDKDAVGRLEFVKSPEKRLDQGGAVRIGICDDDGEVDSGKDVVRLAGEIDGAGTVEDDIAVAEIVEACDVEFGGETSGSRLLAAVADGCSLRH